ncbi:MAG: hypothetical protein WD604_10395 [Balneolaceae bacterium]
MPGKHKSKLPPKTSKFFNAFLKAPTLWEKEVNSLHPKDWIKLYVFVRHCAQYNVSLTTSEFKELLKEQKFSNELIEEIGYVFKHGRSLLKVN